MSTEKEALTAAKQYESNLDDSSEDVSTTHSDRKETIFDWVTRFELSKNEVSALADPSWIIPNLVISSHLIVIAAEPNAGKTTIFSHLAGEMVKSGQKVIYVNADIGGGDVKAAYAQARVLGFSLLLPDFKVGESIDAVGRELVAMSKADVNLQGTVIIVDTLKKLINVQNKQDMKALMKIFRRLNARGMTVILLAHTNKYKDDEGNPIFEGTGDLRADVDELIYLIPHKNEDGSMLVTTKPDKVRGKFEELTFRINANREVTLVDNSLKAQEEIKVNQELSYDAEVIDCIRASLLRGELNQKQLIDECANAGIPVRRVREVIPKYDSSQSYFPVLWEKSKGQGKAYIYSIKS